MFAEITQRGGRVKSYVLYTKSSNIEVQFEKELRECCNVNSLYVVDVSSEKDLQLAIQNAKIKPFFGDNWLLVVRDISEGLVKSVDKYISMLRGSVYLLMVTNQYKRLLDIEKALSKINDIERQKCKVVKYTYLTRDRVLELYSDTVLKHGYVISDSILKYLARGYSREIDSVFQLFESVAQGVLVTTEKQVLKLIGIGNKDVDLLIQTMLRCSRGTLRKNANSRAKLTRLVEALRTDLNIYTLKNRMQVTLQSYIDIKLLIQMGCIRDKDRLGEIPDVYNENCLKYSFRYIDFIKRTPMRDLVVLSENFKGLDSSADYANSIMQTIYSVVG